MAAKTKAGKGGMRLARAMPGKRGAARKGFKLGARRTKRNPYLQAVLRNERTQSRLRDGAKSAGAAYARMTRRGGGAEAALDDRRTRRDLRRAISSFRGAAESARQEKIRRRRRVAARVALPAAAVGGAGVAAAFKKRSAGSDAQAPQQRAPAAA